MGIGGTIGVGSRLASGAQSASALLRGQVDDVIRLGDRAAGSLLATSGNRLTLLEGTETFARSLIDDIGRAQHHVNITEFAIKPGKPGGMIADDVLNALKERARAGVEVNVQLDQIGSGMLLRRPSSSRAMISSLEDAGVAVRVKPATLGRGGVNDARLAADHRKIFEIDGRVAYQGGINLVDDWAPWHDLMVRIEGPAAAQSGALVAGRWTDLGGAVTDARRAVLHAGLDNAVADTAEGVLQLSNGNRVRRELTDHFVRAVDSAQDRVWITNPYLGDKHVMRRVVNAAERGVDVRLVLSPKAKVGGQHQDIFTDPFRRAWAHEIHQAGGRVHRAPEFTHAKAWLIDGEASVGSFNLDRSSTVRNYENAIATRDRSFVEQMEQMFLRQQGRGEQVGDDVVAGWGRLAAGRDLMGLQY